MRYLLIVACCLADQSFAQDPAEHRAGELQIEKRPYRDQFGKTGEYEVGTFYVRENRSETNSRVIGVGFSRFRAKKQKGPPIFFLPGGPGSSFLEQGNGPRLRATPGTVSFLTDACDVICIDQRGFSSRGDILRGMFDGSPPKPEAALDDLVTDYKRFARSVTDRYARTTTDLRGYTVLECVEDVNELRQALGYDKIVLRGQSFGCQWSFAFMRKHPELVERALLSGVEPLNHGYDMPSHVMAAVRRMWKFVDKDPRFADYLPPGGMTEAAETVIKRLETDGIKVSAAGLFGLGKPSVVRILGQDDFPWREPAQILELYHGHTKRWASKRPRMRGRMKLLPILIDTSLGVTEKRRRQLWNDPAVRYLSRRNFAPYLATAEIWPTADVGDDFRTPVECTVPVVFVNGDWDIKTPVENTHEIAPFFPNRHVLIVHQAGHGTITPALLKQHPSVFRALMGFMKTGEIKNLPEQITFTASNRFQPPDFPLPKPDAADQ